MGFLFISPMRFIALDWYIATLQLVLEEVTLKPFGNSLMNSNHLMK